MNQAWAALPSWLAGRLLPLLAVAVIGGCATSAGEDYAKETTLGADQLRTLLVGKNVLFEGDARLWYYQNGRYKFRGKYKEDGKYYFKNNAVCIIFDDDRQQRCNRYIKTGGAYYYVRGTSGRGRRFLARIM